MVKDVLKMAAAKKKTAAKRAAPRGATAAAAAPRRRRSTALKGVAKIPKLGAAAGVAVAYAPDVAWFVRKTIDNPSAIGNYAKATVKGMMKKDEIVKAAKNAIIGYGAGYAAKKFAPKMIKKPIAKIAQKVM